MGLKHLVVLLIGLCIGCASGTSNDSVARPTSRPTYPVAKTGETVDQYHGVAVPDPYRWLEDADSAETKAFVDQQNKLVRDFVDGQTREQIKARLTDLINYPRFSAPRREGERFFFTQNEGLQNQPVLYVSKRADGEDARVLIDPNTFREDGTVALSSTDYTDDGSLLAYGVSSGGSDQKEIHVREVATGNDRTDVIQNAKFASVAWKRTGSSTRRSSSFRTATWTSSSPDRRTRS